MVTAVQTKSQQQMWATSIMDKPDYNDVLLQLYWTNCQCNVWASTDRMEVRECFRQDCQCSEQAEKKEKSERAFFVPSDSLYEFSLQVPPARKEYASVTLLRTKFTDNATHSGAQLIYVTISTICMCIIKLAGLSARVGLPHSNFNVQLEGQ